MIVGVLGAGLIGNGWAALFLARGADVVVVDPREGAGAETARFVAEAWPHLHALGLAMDGAVPEVEVTDRIEAMAGVGFVQENLPDRIEVKHQALARLEAVIGAQVPVASSSSSLMPSDIQAGAAVPGRFLVGHPMNPPHLLPLVEMVAGRQTDPGVMERAQAFYEDMRRVPIRVKREVPGHLANRLTAALYREAVHLLAEGIADVADIDRAIAHGPGMRWALMGPHLIYHLGGGAGGYRAYLEHLGPTQEARWRALGEPVLDETTRAKLLAGIEAELDWLDADSLVARRDAALVELAGLKRKFDF